ncbi:MAG: sulfotransferase [Pseudomonadota bacterium]
MARTIHFISGLPRSGSTLLAGLLRQNPRFDAAMSGPVATLLTTLLGAMSPRNEAAVFLDEARRRRILRAVVDAYYGDDPKDIVFDTNRQWCAQLHLVVELFPEAKVLCTVRNVAWIMDSFERLVRKNTFQPSNLFGSADERASVYSRTEALALRNRVVGSAYSALKEAYYGEHSDKLLLIDYEILTKKPEACLKLIYEFLGQPWFDHDFDHVEYDEPEFDRNLGAPGLHDVSGPVRYQPRRTILPPDLFKQYDGLTFWTDAAGTAAWRIAPEAKPAS